MSQGCAEHSFHRTSLLNSGDHFDKHGNPAHPPRSLAHAIALTADVDRIVALFETFGIVEGAYLCMASRNAWMCELREPGHLVYS
ncbi:hypothetical protein VTO73DRAFT_11877 [Trametes versicolor]